jgi:hypothetical protein
MQSKKIGAGDRTTKIGSREQQISEDTLFTPRTWHKSNLKPVKSEKGETGPG